VGQDFYGTQHYAASFIFEPMGYALGKLFTTFESLYATDPSILNTCAYRSEENGFEHRCTPERNGCTDRCSGEAHNLCN
jgi:hypothetical protein